jgi:hypothetical protein
MNFTNIKDTKQCDILACTLWTTTELELFEYIWDICNHSTSLDSTLSVYDLRTIFDTQIFQTCSDQELIYRFKRLNKFLIDHQLVRDEIFIFSIFIPSNRFFIQFRKTNDWQQISKNVRKQINELLKIALKRRRIEINKAKQSVAEYFFSCKSLLIDDVYKYKNIVYERVGEGINVEEAFKCFKLI